VTDRRASLAFGGASLAFDGAILAFDYGDISG
jgi:hypothetical protein